MNPLVSIVMALYNSEKYVGESLLSVINQTYGNLEIIVVNDGSTDGSAAIVEGMMEKDSRIQLFHQPNRGQCAASNFGYHQSTGGYIKFFDADDILSPDVIELQVKTLQDKNGMAGCFMDYTRFYDDDISTINKFPRHELIKKDCSPVEYITFSGYPQMYNNAIWLFPRKVYEAGGLWDERLSVNNDGEFYPRLLKVVDRLYYTAGCEVLYRTNFNSGSLSQQLSEKGMRSAVLSVDLMADTIRTMQQSPLVEKIIARAYAMTLRMSYPKHPSITKEIEAKLSAFKKEDYREDEKGIWKLAEYLIGWKGVKRLRDFYYRVRY